MSFQIQCFCGRMLRAEPSPYATLKCPGCGWEHAVPVIRAHQAGPGDGRRHEWLGPVLTSTASIVLVLAALVWALLAGGGSGAGGSGRGSGSLVGDGPGMGKSGDGGGAGADNGGGAAGGKGGALAAAPALKTTPKVAVTPKPLVRPAKPTTKPTTRPAGTVFGALQAVEPVAKTETETKTETKDGDEAGKQGAAGGGGFGKGGEGNDPGAKGDASFTLTWGNYTSRQGHDPQGGGPDIDIWVKDPAKNIINTSGEGIIKLGPTSEGGRADIDDQGAYGDGNGGGPERIFWPTGKAPKGTYHYGVRWFQGTGTAQYTLRVYRGTTLVATKTGQLTDNDKGVNKELGTLSVE